MLQGVLNYQKIVPGGSNFGGSIFTYHGSCALASRESFLI